MHGTYIKISVHVLCITSNKIHPIISNVFSRYKYSVPPGVMTQV